MELSKAKIDLYSSLSTKKMRQKHGLFLAEGEKCALDMLGSFSLECLVATEEWLEKNRCIKNKYGGKIYSVKAASMRKISSLSSPPSLLAVFQLPADNILTELNKEKLYLMLDGVQDPGNLGTIIRTAHWFGVDTIIASFDTVDVFNPKVVQSTMGSLKSVEIYYSDLVKVIKSNYDMPVYGLLLDGKNMYDYHISSAHGLIVMGNEGNGISAKIKNLITHPLFIPPYNSENHPESLNVAIATAITLSWFRDQ